MAPRSYNSPVRKDAEIETVRRIVAATVQLHAKKGVTATTHADIAECAGVSIPTVYKHFPTRNALLPACMGEVGGNAPQIDATAILATPDLNARLRLMVEMVHARYRYFHPWFRWTAADAPFVPEITEAANAERKQLELLVKSALAELFPNEIPSDVSALAQMLLDYPAWQRLNELLGTPEEAARAATHMLQLIVFSLHESE